MADSPNYSGLVVAGVGFLLTRFTVALAIYDDPLRFYLAGVLPLALGLGLAAFGVALVVADVDPSLVRTTAVWCLLGTAGMLVLVVLTLVGSAERVSDLSAMRSTVYLSNFLIGGSVGGTLTGLYAARNRRQRTELERQADRLAVLNRLLRDEILNSVTAIQGYASTRDVPAAKSEAVIETHSESIAETVEEVKYLTRQAGREETPTEPVDLGPVLAASVATVTERHPVDVTLETVPDGVAVSANDRLAKVFENLLENAVVHGGDDDPAVGVAVDEETVRVTVSDDGPGLPAAQRAVLEQGRLDGADTPAERLGLGLKVVALLVESYGGSVRTAVDDGTTVTVVLQRARSDGSLSPSGRDLGRVRPALPHMAVVLVAALVAGVVYGVASEALGGSVAGIGVFYGAATPTIGWLTHEFHSVVFGFAFVGLMSLTPARYRERALAYVAVGTGWGVVLWVVAAGVVAPVWLRLLGIEAPLPNLPRRLLVTHLVWGVSLGALTAAGYRYVVPRASAALARHGPDWATR